MQDKSLVDIVANTLAEAKDKTFVHAVVNVNVVTLVDRLTATLP